MAAHASLLSSHPCPSVPVSLLPAAGAPEAIAVMGRSMPAGAHAPQRSGIAVREGEGAAAEGPRGADGFAAPPGAACGGRVQACMANCNPACLCGLCKQLARRVSGLATDPCPTRRPHAGSVLTRLWRVHEMVCGGALCLVPLDCLLAGPSMADLAALQREIAALRALLLGASPPPAGTFPASGPAKLIPVPYLKASPAPPAPPLPGGSETAATPSGADAASEAATWGASRPADAAHEERGMLPPAAVPLLQEIADLKQQMATVGGSLARHGLMEPWPSSDGGSDARVVQVRPGAEAPAGPSRHPISVRQLAGDEAVGMAAMPRPAYGGGLAPPRLVAPMMLPVGERAIGRSDPIRSGRSPVRCT